MLLLALFGCAPAVEGPFALAFAGGEDCVEADVSSLAVPTAFTVEAWLRGDPVESDQPRPFVSWTGLFSLEEDRDGNGTFAVGDEPGTTTVDSVMDGVLHHLAGTWDGTTVDLYVDGQRQAFASAVPTSTPSATLRFGCDGAAHAYEGLLDEVRVSSTVRYTEDFDRPVGPFTADTDTLALFHFDEGTGDTTTDDASGLVAEVEGPEWVSFALTGAQ